MRKRDLLFLILAAISAHAAVRQENFDREPANWEGVNNRSTAFEQKEVKQDFGYHADKGAVGGRIHPAAEPAYYAYGLPKPLTFDSPFAAEGRMYVAQGGVHCMVAFFNTNTLNEWRTPNSLGARINGRGETFHCHLEYCTSRWRAGAGVVGLIVPGERIDAKNLPSGKWYAWNIDYKSWRCVMTLDGDKAEMDIPRDHMSDGATFTHFGILSLIKTWDSGSDIWIDDVSINGVKLDFNSDPKWDALGNRRTYITSDTRPRFNFGWSSTHHAKGKMPGELGGLIFRGDCREPARMAAYGDRIGTLTLKNRLHARGKVCMLRGVTDSTASIGFYNSASSMKSNPSQKNSIPIDYLGINIEGPSAEGFFFYPVFRGHGDDDGKALGSNGNKSPRIYPDGKPRDWFLEYDPAKRRLTVGLDAQTCTMDLDRETEATFDRFGICTPWIDGNSVTVFFDDLEYTVE
jgi:hypothetical protein